MTEATVYKKIQNFYIPSITFSEFYFNMLRESDASNPITIFWEKLDGDRTVRDMFWGMYVGGKASQTRKAEGMIALVSIDDGEDYRTVTLDSVWKCKYQGKTYYVK
jgi:hypothetical protein